MTAEYYLNQYRRAVEREARCQSEYEKELILIDAVRSLSDNDGMPHGSGTSKPTEDKAIRLADAHTKLVDAKLEALRIRRHLFEEISKVPGVKGDILIGCYIDLMDLGELADLMNYSDRHIRRLHREAVEDFEKLVQKCPKMSEGPVVL